jgi:glucarate dehydratase
MARLTIEGATLTRLSVPLVKPYISSQMRSGRDRIERTIIRLHGSDGTIGLGETVGTPPVFGIVRRLCQRLKGRDAFAMTAFRREWAPLTFSNMDGRHGFIGYGGVEAACYDLLARHLGVPLVDLLGGSQRASIPCAGLMGAIPVDGAIDRPGLEAFIADAGNVAKVVEEAEALVADGGYPSLKIKSVGLDRGWDLAVMTALRERFGPRMGLRLDANGAFSPVEALRLGRGLERLDLEYFEDPVSGIEGLSRLRRDLRTPIATNMAIINMDQLPVGIRMGAADVILGDIFHWGGLRNFIDLAAVARAFELGLGMHSFWEMGVATAFNLHLAAALPGVDHPIDGILWLYPDDITAGARMAVRHGMLPLPHGPGIGVSLDEAKLAAWAVETVEV